MKRYLVGVTVKDTGLKAQSTSYIINAENALEMIHQLDGLTFFEERSEYKINYVYSEPIE